MLIKLNPDEINKAAQIGQTRTIEAKKLGHKSDVPPDVAVKREFAGACAEVAASKFFNVPLPETFNINGADLGQNIQIRSTKHLRGRLIVRDRDFYHYPDHVFIMVLDRHPYYQFVGGIEISQVRYIGYRDTNVVPKGFLVDQHDLLPIDKLPIKF